MTWKERIAISATVALVLVFWIYVGVRVYQIPEIPERPLEFQAGQCVHLVVSGEQVQILRAHRGWNEAYMIRRPDMSVLWVGENEVRK